MRKKKRHTFVSLSVRTSENDSFELPFYDSYSNTEEIFLKKEQSEALYKSISKLPDIQKKLITLRDINGLSYNDISKELNLKSGTVKSGLNRARKKLRVILEEIDKF